MPVTDDLLLEHDQALRFERRTSEAVAAELLEVAEHWCSPDGRATVVEKDAVDGRAFRVVWADYYAAGGYDTRGIRLHRGAATPARFALVVDVVDDVFAVVLVERDVAPGLRPRVRELRIVDERRTWWADGAGVQGETLTNGELNRLVNAGENLLPFWGRLDDGAVFTADDAERADALDRVRRVRRQRVGQATLERVADVFADSPTTAGAVAQLLEELNVSDERYVWKLRDLAIEAGLHVWYDPDVQELDLDTAIARHLELLEELVPGCTDGYRAAA